MTLKNLADVRRNPTCYNLPMIPCLLPSEVIFGEQFVNSDLLRLISSGASTSGCAEIEISDQRLVARSPSGPSASNSEGSGLYQPSLRHSNGGRPPENLPLPSRVGKSVPPSTKD